MSNEEEIAGKHHETLVVLCDVVNHYLGNKFIIAPREGSGAEHDPVMQRAMDHLRKMGAEETKPLPVPLPHK